MYFSKVQSFFYKSVYLSNFFWSGQCKFEKIDPDWYSFTEVNAFFDKVSVHLRISTETGKKKFIWWIFFALGQYRFENIYSGW